MRRLLPIGLAICTLLAALSAWPQQTTKPATRAELTGNRLSIPEIKTSFTIPQAWVRNRESFKLDSGQIAELSKPPKKEWDSAYGPVADAVLPLSDCLCHLGSEPWGEKGVSYFDIQMRAYLTDTKPDALQKSLEDKGAKAAADTQGTAIKTDSKTDGLWSINHISFDLFYIDYGAIANVYFYSRPAGDKTLVLVFMMVDRPESTKDREAIVKSVEIPPPATKPQ